VRYTVSVPLIAFPAESLATKVIAPAAVEPLITVFDSTVGINVSAKPTNVTVLAAWVRFTPPIELVIVIVPAVPSEYTVTVSPEVELNVTDLAFVAAVVLVDVLIKPSKPGPETVRTTLAVTAVPAVDVRVSEEFLGSTNM